MPHRTGVVMKALPLRPGDTARVEIDANQIHREPLTVHEGPIESIMMEPMGQLEGKPERFPGSTRASILDGPGLHR